MDLSWL